MLPWIILIIILFFALGALAGAPYLPIRKNDMDDLLKLANLKPGQRLIDLGSGDGRFLKYAAKHDIYATGYEINPLLFLYSYFNCIKYRKYITIKLTNFWTADIAKAEVIYVFLITHHMQKLSKKLRKELRTSTKVISYIYQLPRKQYLKSTRNAYLYIYPKSTKVSH